MFEEPLPVDTDPAGLSLVAYVHAEADGSEDPPLDLAAFCAGRGICLVGTVREAGDVKALKPFEERPRGRDVLQRIREGAAHGILVPTLDHVFSSVADAVATLERWSEEGVAFVCVRFAPGTPLVLRGHDGERAALADVFAGLSQFHRRVVARKVRAQLETKRSRGEWQGRVPYGFTAVDGRLVEDPVQMKRIVEMKRAHRRGKSYREIAARFDVSVATAHRLVNTDLRLLKRGRVPSRRGTGNDFVAPVDFDAGSTS